MSRQVNATTNSSFLVGLIIGAEGVAAEWELGLSV